MPKGAPRGPSKSEISAEEELERQRVRYSNEKRLFIERVASYEILATERSRSMMQSFEFSPETTINPDAIKAPGTFDPTYTPSDPAAAPQWYYAPNLGISQPVLGVQIPKPPRKPQTMWHGLNQGAR